MPDEGFGAGGPLLAHPQQGGQVLLLLRWMMLSVLPLMRLILLILMLSLMLSLMSSLLLQVALAVRVLPPRPAQAGLVRC